MNLKAASFVKRILHVTSRASFSRAASGGLSGLPPHGVGELETGSAASSTRGERFDDVSPAKFDLEIGELSDDLDLSLVRPGIHDWLQFLG